MSDFKERGEASPRRSNTDESVIQTILSPASDSFPHLNDPPLYVEQGPNLQERVSLLKEDAQRVGQVLPILECPYEVRYYRLRPAESLHDSTRMIRQEIVKAYFDAIKAKNDEVIALFIDNGLVTPETTNDEGRTPLLAAIEAGNIRTVQQLMDFDADVNAYGVTAGLPKPRYGKGLMETSRTPLQLAAEKGNMTIIKLLMETYQADSSLIAPDGQHALRLAATNGHREIVQYLPSQRGGGWRRWKAKHQKAMRRVKAATINIYKFFKILLWYVPKFFVWDVPKDAIVRPMMKGAQWLREHRKEIPTLVAEWLKRVAKRLGKWARAIPKDIWKFVKGIPEAVKDFFLAVWKVIKRTPKAAKVLFLWIWGGLKEIGARIGHILGRFLSFVHTVFTAIITFFRNLTLEDVWDGFTSFLRAVFVDFPKQIWKWLRKFEEISLKVFETLFGCLGCIVWWLGRAIVELFIYVPKKIAVILAGFAQSMGSGYKEVLIWINPKRS